jgi:hypothetical protein
VKLNFQFRATMSRRYARVGGDRDAPPPDAGAETSEASIPEEPRPFRNNEIAQRF